MRILIHDRLKPYSHTPGTSTLLPFTQFLFTIYPALIQVTSLQTEPQLIQEIPLNLTSPVEQFTVQLDLERGWIKVWGTVKEGFFSYRIQKQEEHWAIAIEKDATGALFSGTGVDNIKTKPKPTHEFREHLSFGSHKAQNSDEMRKRGQMTEIFPFWFRLSQMTLKTNPAFGGVADLLQKCQQAIAQEDPQILDQAFTHLFRAGFEGIFVPRLRDTDHQGFLLSEPQKGGAPLWLLQEGGRLIRALFFQEKEKQCSILPCVPPQYHYGKMKGVASHCATFDIEWTKKQLRRMVIFGRKNDELELCLPKIKRFRLRAFKTEKTVEKRTVILKIQEGETYFLDRFER